MRDEDYKVHIEPLTFALTEVQRMQLPDPFHRSEQLPKQYVEVMTLFLFNEEETEE